MENSRINRQINTNVGNIYNVESASALSYGYWDENVIFSFASKLKEPTEQRTYDWEHAIKTAIPKSKIALLLMEYEHKLEKLLKEDSIYFKEEDKPNVKELEMRNIFVKLSNNRSRFVIGVNEFKTEYKEKYGLRYFPYILFHKVTEEGENEAFFFFDFEPKELFYNYSPSKPDEYNVAYTFSQWFEFINDLRNFRDATSKAYNHIERYLESSITHSKGSARQGATSFGSSNSIVPNKGGIHSLDELTNELTDEDGVLILGGGNNEEIPF